MHAATLLEAPHRHRGRPVRGCRVADSLSPDVLILGRETAAERLSPVPGPALPARVGEIQSEDWQDMSARSSVTGFIASRWWRLCCGGLVSCFAGGRKMPTVIRGLLKMSVAKMNVLKRGPIYFRCILYRAIFYFSSFPFAA